MPADRLFFENRINLQFFCNKTWPLHFACECILEECLNKPVMRNLHQEIQWFSLPTKNQSKKDSIENYHLGPCSNRKTSAISKQT